MLGADGGRRALVAYALTVPARRQGERRGQRERGGNERTEAGRYWACGHRGLLGGAVGGANSLRGDSRR
ncbi:hypothetical protein [Streptomyces sp. NPDC086787]|uniref:hypothetical protein n=1 Tax=Streptomyces sp. NPDC086787 TaxID=3365759 RepID=UPI0037F2542F